MMVCCSYSHLEVRRWRPRSGLPPGTATKETVFRKLECWEDMNKSVSSEEIWRENEGLAVKKVTFNGVSFNQAFIILKCVI